VQQTAHIPVATSAAPRSEELVAEVEAFLRVEPLVPHFADSDERFAYLVGYQRRLHEVALAVPAWPSELGGRGLGPRDAAAVATALGRGGAPELINFVGTDVLAPALFQFAGHERLGQWMPRIASAEEIWCQLFSEPDAGSDLTSLRTRAQQVSDGWRINGQKVWSTWAQYARWGFLLARTGSVEARHRGITAFAVDMRSPGITIRPLQTMTRAAEFAEVFFDDTLLPSDAVIGEVDNGWSVAQVILNAERGPYAIRRASVIGAALGRLLENARSAPCPADARAVVTQAYLDFRLLEWRIARLVEQLAAGGDVGPESPITKQLMTAAEQSTYAASLHLLGSHGAAWTTPDVTAIVEDYLYSRAASIYGGTAQIQRNLIGERLLGLPREPSGR